MSRFESTNLRKTILLQQQAFEKLSLDGPTMWNAFYCVGNNEEKKIRDAFFLLSLRRCS